MVMAGACAVYMRMYWFMLKRSVHCHVSSPCACEWKPRFYGFHSIMHLCICELPHPRQTDTEFSIQITILQMTPDLKRQKAVAKVLVAGVHTQFESNSLRIFFWLSFTSIHFFTLFHCCCWLFNLLTLFIFLLSCRYLFSSLCLSFFFVGNKRIQNQ